MSFLEIETREGEFVLLNLDKVSTIAKVYDGTCFTMSGEEPQFYSTKLDYNFVVTFLRVHKVALRVLSHE